MKANAPKRSGDTIRFSAGRGAALGDAGRDGDAVLMPWAALFPRLGCAICGRCIHAGMRTLKPHEPAAAIPSSLLRQ